MLTHALSRRGFLASLAAICAARPAAAAQRPGLAVSFDDFSLQDQPLLGAGQRDARIRSALTARGLKAAAFPTGANARRPEVAAALRAWSRDGHMIGNHTQTHPYFSGDDPEAFLADIDAGEAVLAQFDMFERWFRFPYLAEGRTAAGRDAVRAGLAARGYRNAHVTIDASDWYVDQRLRRRIEEGPGADLAPYRDYYLTHLIDRARFYDALGRDLTGRADLPHMLLLHHNLSAALFLDDALAMFVDAGWRLVDAPAALSDPVYTAAPDSLPAGQSLFWAMANAAGGYEERLRWPGEGARWEEDAMDAAGL